jgi:hypothetical protein
VNSQKSGETSTKCASNPPKDIDAIIAERKDAAKRAKEAVPLAPEKHAGAGRGNKTVSETNGFKSSDCNAEYLTRRIARDNPELLERMKAGEFKSVRAAAI